MFEQYIGRIVVALTALLLPFVAAFANWVQDVTQVDLDENQLTALIVSCVLGTGAVVFKWLSNRGAYERAVLELEKIYEQGAAIAHEHAPPAPEAPAAAPKKAAVADGPRKKR